MADEVISCLGGQSSLTDGTLERASFRVRSRRPIAVYVPDHVPHFLQVHENSGLAGRAYPCGVIRSLARTREGCERTLVVGIRKGINGDVCRLR